MPFLDDAGVRRLLNRPPYYCGCGECRLDYCRTCDEFYWVHRPHCINAERATDKPHYGHRLTLVPFVEDRYSGRH